MPDLSEDPLANYDPGTPPVAPAGAVSVAQEPPAQPEHDTYTDVPPPPEPEEQEYFPPADFDQVPDEFSMDDVPPPDYDGPSDDGYAPRRDRGDNDRPHRGKLPPGTEEERAEMAELVIDTMRRCIAAAHGRFGQDVIDLAVYLMSSENALAYIDPTRRRTWKRMSEVIIACAADDPHREFDLFDIPDLEAASPAVVGEMHVVRALTKTDGLPQTPTSTWRALCDRVQRLVSLNTARQLITGIVEDLPDDELMTAFTALQPPTSRKTIVNAAVSKTAKQWEDADRLAAASRPIFRISSGYTTWDWAFTAKNPDGSLAEPLGCWAPGELHLLAAPTGNGKSALSRRLITAAAEDLVVGWGHEHAKVLIAITEEAPKIVYRAAGLAEGEPFHHLADNVVIADVGASRKRFIHAIWDLVIEAYHRSKETGMPIVDCGLPELVVLDYVGGLQEGSESEQLATETTANLLMRGVAGWRVDSQNGFSGENFAEYAGMSWPEGMENFQPAVLGFVQFRKLEGVQFYDPENKQCLISDFTVENPDGTPGWEVKPGDFRVPKQSEVRGSGILINHATSLTIMSRSRPQKNPPVTDPETKKRRLADDRARFILVKTRNGADLAFVPMRFDSNWKGERGQFYDLLAERAIEAGKLATLPSYTRPGDPILPPRPSASPFAGVAY